MAERDILQSMIVRRGQCQNERTPRELGVHFADVDERTTEELLLFTRRFADFVNYYPAGSPGPDGTWEAFFPGETEIKQVLENNTGTTSPHLALFLAFLELYKKPQQVVNRITGGHLDFYFKDVLRFTKKTALADRAHLLLELKKKAAPIEISPADLFSGGKDPAGAELIYVPTRDSVINTAKVDSLRSLFLDMRAHGTVRCAPIANSSDGTGGELQGAEPKWFGFGHEDLPDAEVGFAIASPVLRMKEGVRKITLALTLANVDSSRVNTGSLSDAFEVFITGEKNWIGPYRVSPVLSSENTLTFEITVSDNEKGVVDYDAKVHGYAYIAQAPIIQAVLKAGNAEIGYADFVGITLKTATVAIVVSDITSLNLESDGAVLDPKKPFQPFGSQPAKGSRFLVGCREALSKKLSKLDLTVTWKNAPDNFSTYYDNYSEKKLISNSYFTAAVSFKDGGSWVNSSPGVHLFNSNDTSKGSLSFAPSTKSASPSATEGMIVHALHTAGSFWSLRATNKYVLKKPVFMSFRTTVPEAREGYITFSLEKDFLHSAYRHEYVKNVMTNPPIILREPYTPVIQNIALSYEAHSDEVSIASNRLEDFTNSDVHFFHLSYFGQMREHGYQRQQLGFVSDKRVALLPQYPNEGELIIGFTGLNAGDSVSLLFQVAEGSDKPEQEQENISWSVLCDNYWKPLGADGVVLDTTNQLLTSGIITFILPPEATLSNTVLPTGHIWIKAAVQQHVKAVCQLIEIAANAVEVQFMDNQNDPSHLLTPLEKGTITKLKRGSSSIKTVKQPYASFGGRAVESDDTLYTRASERLRHKNRCITIWDYERIILEAFPSVHKVKCLPHAREDCWLAPGNVLIVVIPDLKNKNAVDPLQPKISSDTIDRITGYVQARTGMQTAVAVKNPLYQKIQLDFKVKFLAGKEFNYYSKELNQALTRFLSPWAYEQDGEISFGGTVYKSVLLDFVEELEYVDYIEDFKMYSYTEGTRNARDISEARPETPDSILVSEIIHIINRA